VGLEGPNLLDQKVTSSKILYESKDWVGNGVTRRNHGMTDLCDAVRQSLNLPLLLRPVREPGKDMLGMEFVQRHDWTLEK
jgi:hypothetical protein